ncbi:MAG: hypothetical protein IKX54_04730 [Lachnospiraceae bacterium]|nr:hypothetical protein [Lachnospiraceae bacterium]
MRTKPVVIAVLAALLLTACGQEKKEEGIAFSFTYSYWYNEEQKTIFSTERGVIQKDLVAAGVETADWNISEKDLKELKRLTEEYDAAALAEALNARKTSDGDVMNAVSPERTCELVFTLDGKECRLTVRSSDLFSLASDSKLAPLVIYFEKFEEVLKAQEVYASMPEADGAYQ